MNNLPGWPPGTSPGTALFILLISLVSALGLAFGMLIVILLTAAAYGLILQTLFGTWIAAGANALGIPLLADQVWKAVFFLVIVGSCIHDNVGRLQAALASSDLERRKHDLEKELKEG